MADAGELVAGGWWLVAGGWWLVAGGWWLEGRIPRSSYRVPLPASLIYLLFHKKYFPKKSNIW